MNKHYVLSLNPNAQHPWDRCILRHPITAERPDFASSIAEAVGEQPGTYLVSVSIEVKVLEQAPLPPASDRPVEVSVTRPPAPLKEVA